MQISQEQKYLFPLQDIWIKVNQEEQSFKIK